MTLKTSGPFFETGNLETFEHATCHDYVACDVTAAYQSPGSTTDGNPAKVKEASRQLVFVRPEIVIVFDRVESLDASYQKRFLLHASGTGVVPVVSGSSFTIDNNGGRLLGQTLLPAGAAVNLVQNFSIAGTAYPPDLSGLPGEPEVGGNRVEVVPAAPALRDYFLHVFDATDPSKSTLDASVVDTADTSTATVVDGPNTYVVSFAKTGALGGHITVTGTVSCDQDLGGSTSSGTGGGGAGGSPGSGGGGASGSPTAKGGCSCRTAGGEGSTAGIPMLLSLLALAGRRKARPVIR
jgi:MYXO-CTERM domain-containing protein